VSSAGDKSAMERKCRGAKGEVFGLAELEYDRAFDKYEKAVLVGRSDAEAIAIARS
jgi:hypothetical protein